MIRIALALKLVDSWEHGVVRGFTRYAKTQSGWKLHGYHWMFLPLQDLCDWDGDAVVVRLTDRTEGEIVSRLPCVVVDVANTLRLPSVHHVHSDDIETGRMAARYLREKGFTAFGYLGLSGKELSRQRLGGFCQELGSHAVSVFERPALWWEESPVKRSLKSFVARQVKPMAFFSCSDKAALRFSEACDDEGIKVPNDVALLSVSADDIPCEIASTSFSSFDLDSEEVGWQAADLIHQLIKEKPAAQRYLRTVSPKGIIERRSTDIYSRNDPLVLRAQMYLASEGGHLSSVLEITDALAVSRRTLETRFKRATGHTVHNTILHRRIQMAMHLLQTTDQKIEVIAGLIGFSSVQRLFAQFKRLTGLTPNQIRLTKRPVALRWP